MSLIENCVFCKIIRSELPCSKLHENDLLLAFLDIAPFNLGHALIVPKVHHHSCTTLPEEYLKEIMLVANRVAVAQMRALKADAFNLLLNNGSCAGQEVPHVHLHVIPRFADDETIFRVSKKKYESNLHMQEIAESISSKIKI